VSLTSAQLQAIAARGNVLVVAGAGTGKTRTLVERCLGCLLHERPRASLDEVMMVTFTEAAAAEMRQRIRTRLEEELQQHPGDAHLQEQLALFDAAHIGTLHSFCFQLVRQHFYELGLDPQLSVLAEEEAEVLAGETLDQLLETHYAGRGGMAGAVQDLIQAQSKGGDQPVRALVLRLHRYSQTRPDPEGWLNSQTALFATDGPTAWQRWLLKAIPDWRDEWLPTLEAAAGANSISRISATALKRLPAAPSQADAAAALKALVAALGECPKGKKTLLINPLEDFFDEARFLLSLVCADRPNASGDTAPSRAEADPLTEDWNWSRTQMITLLELAREFTAEFSAAKRDLGALDFHDLEQFALRLLWDSQAQAPTPIASDWQKKLRFVFVDEYQDINAAQDKIIEALSRGGARANRFLVGDVKQSIYRFRLAEPRIFQGYVKHWSGAAGKAIPLADNFRSRERLLDFINSLFSTLMRPELGGVAYNQQAQLRFGAKAERQPLSTAADSAPCVELHLRLIGTADSPEGDGPGSGAWADVRDLAEAAKEALLVALRLQELKASQHPVWDQAAEEFRPVDWGDIAILLRSPANKAESYAKEFTQLGVPLEVARSGFYRSLEISDLLNLLQLLDNPLQDLPALAVLHSPLVGLTLDELAAIRLTLPKGHFWAALVKWRELRGPQPSEEPTLRKVTTFLDRFGRWRRLARHVSLSGCLETVLSETLYAEWLLTQPRGDQRHANVRRLASLAQDFDRFQRQGLFRFLRFVEAQQLAETEPEVASIINENAVRLMSIHQSKGLEFPVVVAADMGKPFNLKDLRAQIILDEEYGLCPQVKPPHTGKSYPSLPYWLARRRQARELLGEELRLLYVAMTRARDTLILSASVPENRLELWKQNHDITLAALTGARSYADWLRLWFSHNVNAAGGLRQGETDCLRWFVHDDTHLRAPAETTPAETSKPASLTADPEAWRQLQQRLSWQYPFAAATRQPAKTSVSALRRRAASTDSDESALLEVQEFQLTVQTPLAWPGRRLPAVDVGNAHHAFLQNVSLAEVGSAAALRAEAQRLQRAGALAPEEAAQLDFAALATFWDSDLGRKIRDHPQSIRRELAFTARFPANELASLSGESPDPGLEEEFVVVQGVADLAVILPAEIWLVDFKTDAVGPEDLAGKVKNYEPQLRLYSRALSQIYRRPVSESWLYFLALRTAVAVAPPQGIS
jgi:ATP-dependent helicase/nuclease subunit A